MLYCRAEIFRQSPLRKKRPCRIGKGVGLLYFFRQSYSLSKFAEDSIFPQGLAQTQKAHHLFTGGALDFSYLGKCFILRLRQNYLRGLLIAACAAARRAMGTRKGEQLT